MLKRHETVLDANIISNLKQITTIREKMLQTIKNTF